MKPHALASLLLGATLAACTTKPAPPVPPTEAEWHAIFADDYTCTPANSTNVDFRSVATSSNSYLDKCIRVRALLKRADLFENAAAPPGTGIRLTLEDMKSLMALATHPQFVVVAGRLRSCAARKARIDAFMKRVEVSGWPAPSDGSPGGGAVNIILTRCEGLGLYATTVDVIPTAMD